LSATLEPVEWWRVALTWSVIDLQVETAPGSTDASLRGSGDLSPKQQIGLRSLWNLGKTWEVDAWWRWVDELSSTRPVAAYSTLNLRVGKQLGHGWEVSVVANNLFEPTHPEFIFSALRSEVPREVYLRIDWRR
jgi:iron complex outermembrane receptor protein